MPVVAKFPTALNFPSCLLVRSEGVPPLPIFRRVILMSVGSYGSDNIIHTEADLAMLIDTGLVEERTMYLHTAV